MGGAVAPIIGSVAGGLISKSGADSQAEAQAEAAEQSQNLPPWLEPYMTGQAAPTPQPIPLNYNWLDALNAAATTGMPQQPMPPMSMNNPMMTFNNVNTPYSGGPWGLGMGPGVPTKEAGIPGGPGSQFVEPPEGFVPGAPVPEEAGGGGDGGMGSDLMEIVMRLQDKSRGGMMSGDGTGGGPSAGMDFDRSLAEAKRIQKGMAEGLSMRELYNVAPRSIGIMQWLQNGYGG